VATDVARGAADVLAASTDWRAAVARFDATLRAPRRLNPGTTADLVAAALYILLRDGRLPHERIASELSPIPLPFSMPT
jgi:triphosphoribosyl-dephospho-CoA synthetase